jgi:hypothetical protein
MKKKFVTILAGALVVANLAGPIAAQSKPAKELKLFLRWDGDGAGGCAATYLSIEDAPDEGNGCAFTFQPAQEALIASGQGALTHEWPGLLPKPAKGQAGVVKGEFQVEAYGAANATLEIVLRATTSSGSTEIGSFTSDALNLAPTQTALVSFELPMPKELVGKKIEAVSLSTTFRGASAQSYIELDAPAAFISLPVK